MHGRRVAKRVAAVLIISCVLLWELVGHRVWLWGVPIPHKKPEFARLLLVADPQLQGFRNEPPGLFGILCRWDVYRFMSNYVRSGFDLVEPDRVVFLGDLLDEGSIASPEEFSSYADTFHTLFPLSVMPRQSFIPGDNDIGGEGGEAITADRVALFSHYFGPTNGLDFSENGLSLTRVNTLAASGNVDVEVRRDMEKFLYFQGRGNTDSSLSTVLLSHLPVSQLPVNYAVSAFRSLKTATVFSAHDHCLRCTAVNPQDGTVMGVAGFKGRGRELVYVDGDDLPCHGQDSSTCVLDVTVPTVSYRMGVSCMALTMADVDAGGRIEHLLVVPLPYRLPVLLVYVIFAVLGVVAFWW